MVAILSVVIWVVAVVGFWSGVAYLVDPFGHREIRSKLSLGLTEAEVRAVLGEPRFEYDQDTAPTEYYVNGWSRRERPITGRVLIFMFGEPICYVWFDETGQVEEYFVGGS